jgi:hypothetical protein
LAGRGSLPLSCPNPVKERCVFFSIEVIVNAFVSPGLMVKRPRRGLTYPGGRDPRLAVPTRKKRKRCVRVFLTSSRVSPTLLSSKNQRGYKTVGRRSDSQHMESISFQVWCIKMWKSFSTTPPHVLDKLENTTQMHPSREDMNH